MGTAILIGYFAVATKLNNVLNTQGNKHITKPVVLLVTMSMLV